MKGELRMNAEQMMDKLREVDLRLWEQVLDIIAWKGYGRVGTWDCDEGDMILLEDEEE